MSKGFTIQYVENMTSKQFSRLDISDAKEVTKVIRDAINKREKRIEKAGLSTAIFKKSGFDKTTKGKELYQLKSNIIEGINLLKDDRSTLKGARVAFEKFKEKADKEDIKPQYMDKFWQVFDRVSSDPFLKAILYEYNRRYGSDQIFDDIHSELTQNPDDDVETIYNNLSERLTSWYENL